MILTFILFLGSLVLCIVVAWLTKLVFFPQVTANSTENVNGADHIFTHDNILNTLIRECNSLRSLEDWQLQGVTNGYRIWRKVLIDNQNTEATCCSYVINCPSLVLLNFIKNPSSRHHWIPCIHHVAVTDNDSTVVKGGSAKLDGTLNYSHAHQQDTIHIQFKKRTESLSWCQKLLCLFPYVAPVEDPTQASTTSYQRYYNEEDNGLCWMLEQEILSTKWHFFAIQYQQEKAQQCLVTIIANTTQEEDIKFIVNTLTCLKEHFLVCHNNYGIVPYNANLSANDLSDNHGSFPRNVEPSGDSIEDFDALHKILHHNRNQHRQSLKAPNKETVLHSGNKDKAKRKSPVPVINTDNKVKKHESCPQLMDVPDSQIPIRPTSELERNLVAVERIREYSSKPSEKKPLPRRSLHLPINNVLKPKTPSSDDEALQKGRLHLGDIAQVTDLGLDSPHITYRTLANQTAAQIITEVFRVSDIDLRESREVQLKSTHGWVYQSVEKDVVILRKMHSSVKDSSKTSLLSFIGKGLIKLHPKIVWNALRNPHTRFTYDDTLKKVDILHDFGSGMKIVYLFHEMNHLFKKESRDFCVLHSERLESENKYIVSMRSIDYPDCSLTPSATRGVIYPSGWVIESVPKHNKIYSMVTYVIQMDVMCSPNDPIEEIVTRQPLCIANLRNYLLTPFAIPSP